MNDHSTAAATSEQFSALELALMISDASIDPTFALDKEQRVISWNTACELATGMTRHKALGERLADIRPDMAGLPAIAKAIEAGLRGFKSFVPWEATAYESGYHEHHFVPLNDRQRGICGVLVIMHDVAHRMKAEQELKRLNKALTLKNKQLRRRAEDMAQFNWIASHDLKEPLRKIYLFIEMAATKEGEKLSETARANLRRAQGSVQRMGLLTDDIVSFSEAAAPNEPLAEVPLEGLLEASRLRYRKLMADTGAVVESAALPVITGYPKLLQHLWDHMLGNALKFHKQDEHPLIHIDYRRLAGAHIAVAEADADATYHCLSFRDNGIGFEPQYADKIFGMFQRLDPKSGYKGTGMGLPICQKIAEAHDGFITAESSFGSGTTFTCYLKDMAA